MDCLRSVTSVLPWLCIQCGPGYTQGFTLKKYMKTHSRGNLFNCKKCGLGLSQCCNFKKHMETHAGVFCTERSVVQGFHNVVPWRNIWEHIPKKPIELQGGWFRISFSVETSRNTWEHIHVEMHQVQCRIFTRSSSWCSYTNTNWREPILLPRVLTRIFNEW